MQVQDDIPALIEGLKGKRLGVASLGSGADTVGSGFLAENGLGDSDFTKVAVGTGGTALAAMAAGGIDAMVTYEPDLTQVLKAGTGKVALDFRSTKSGSDYGRLPATTMQATSKWIDDEPEAAASVVRAIAKANATLRNDAETSVTALSKLYPSIDPGDVAAMLEGERNSFISAIAEDQYAIAQKIYKDIKLVEIIPPYQDVVASQFANLWT